MLARIEMAKEACSADDCLAFLSFYDNVNLFEYGPWFDEWLAEHRGDDDWESGIAIFDDKPRADADQLLTEMTRLCVTEEGFWWVVLPKHSEGFIETRFQALTDGRTKGLLDMGV